MTQINIRFPEDNPFSRIKLRHLIGWLFLLATAISFQIVMIGSTRGIKLNPKDPLASEIFAIYLFILLVALLWRQCRLAGIEIKPTFRSSGFDD